jgi:hypothetical protein
LAPRNTAMRASEGRARVTFINEPLPPNAAVLKCTCARDACRSIRASAAACARRYDDTG